MAALREANASLVEVLSAQVANQHDRRASEGHLACKRRQVDGILLCVVRAQSKFQMPLVTAALSILAETNQVPREFWLALRAFFHGTVAVESWVDGILTLARDLRPPPDYAVLPGVAVGVFDNLSMQMNYGSYMREGGRSVCPVDKVAQFHPRWRAFAAAARASQMASAQDVRATYI